LTDTRFGFPNKKGGMVAYKHKICYHSSDYPMAENQTTVFVKHSREASVCTLSYPCNYFHMMLQQSAEYIKNAIQVIKQELRIKI